MNKIRDGTKIKWYSTTEYIDTETGEIITKSLAEREYIINKKTKKYEIHETIGNIKHSNECTRSRQQKIEF